MFGARPTGRGKGGSRQRRRGDELHSELATFLVDQAAWSLMSPQLVQQIAAKAHLDTQVLLDKHNLTDRFVGIKELSEIGTSGTYPNTCKRDLYNLLTGVALGKPTDVQLPLTNASGALARPYDQQIYFPHVWFSEMFEHYPEAFSLKVAPSREKLCEFWDAVQDHPQMEDHPLKDRVGYRRRAVPVALHGDGVPVVGVGKSWSKTCNIYSWCSMLAKGNTLSYNFNIWSVFSDVLSHAFNNKTQHEFWKML